MIVDGAEVRIELSEAAAKLIEEATVSYASKIGDGMSALVVWIAEDPNDEKSIPHLGLGYIERDKVSVERLLPNTYSKFEIYQYLPDYVIHLYNNHVIDYIEESLVFVPID